MQTDKIHFPLKDDQLNRRQFLKKIAFTSTAIASPSIITSSALGNSKIPPASDRITLGHIGVGGRGSSLLQSFLQLDDAQSISVCDPFQNRRRECAGQIEAHYAEKFSKSSYKGCAAYNDFRDLLARDDIDAVVIATPDHWHVPIALAAARLGKDIYVEKPLGVSVAENQALRKAIKRYGNVFHYGTQQRSSRNFRFACELVRNKRIGDLHTIHAWCADITSQVHAFHEPGGSMTPIPVPKGFDYDMWIGPAPLTPYTSDRCKNWGSYHHYDNSLGFIAGWGAHPLDIAQWGNDSDHYAPIEYRGTGKIANKGLFETTYDWDVWCKYENGVKMRFMSTNVARSIVQQYHPKFIDHGTTFIGTEGWVSVDRIGIYANPPSLIESFIGPHEIHLYKSKNHYQNFLECVKIRTETVSTIAAAVQSDIISHLSDIAVRKNRTIRWDSKKKVIIGDPEASRSLVRSMRSTWRL